MPAGVLTYSTLGPYCLVTSSGVHEFLPQQYGAQFYFTGEENSTLYLLDCSTSTLKRKLQAKSLG